MKASELRIGNYVKPLKPRHSEDYLTIESILTDSVNHEFREYGINEIQPIPRTEEWLIKLGFENGDSKGFEKFEWIKEVVSTENLRSVIIIGIGDSDGSFIMTQAHEDSTWMPIQCEHVHQLQNLYFALKGEELQ